MASKLPTEEDVAAAVKTRLAAGTNFATIVPGGVHYARRPSGKAFPYVVLTVEAGDREDVDSSGDFCQTFKVAATAWVKSADDAAAASGAVRTFLDTYLGGSAASPAGGVTVTTAAATLSVTRRTGRLTLAPELRAGQDVLATATMVDVRVQGTQETVT